MEQEIFNQVKESLLKNLQAPILSDKLTGKLSGINTDEISEILTSVYSRLVENRGRILEREKECSDKIHKVSNWLTTSTKPGLLLYGNTGTGKTILMESLKEILKTCRPYDTVKFLTARDLFYKFTGETDHYSYYQIKSSPVTFIDDLGCEPPRCLIYADIAAQARQTEREYVSGENHYFFGSRYILKVVYTTSGANSVEVHGDSMTMKVRKGSSVERKAELMNEWYREHLKEYIGTLMNKWTTKLEETDVTWQIKIMKTQWGSCGAKRRALLFNLELARVPKECIEYVVVHELTHLQVQNHSKVFEALLSQRIPNWRNLRKELNEFIAMPL